ncbi:MAG: hypothetical protein GDA38_10160 [Hormoscilla sp. SP12CHS1]|nr:hypothetical protein [Hormoscilla sp. SP12CHS1]
MNKQRSGKVGESPDNQSIRKKYERYSVTGFYQQFGDDYRNPHEPAINRMIQLAVQKWPLDLQKVLDLACGSGEVTLALHNFGYDNIDAIDPYTYNAYSQRTGKGAETYSFEDIGNGILWGRYYSLIICSFALHLLSESRLPIVAYNLSAIADSLVIITPHKRPHLQPEWGWNYRDELVLDSVRSRFYVSRVLRIEN